MATKEKTNIATAAEQEERKAKSLRDKYINLEGQGFASAFAIDKLFKAAGKLVAPFTQVQNAAIELAKSVGLSSKSIMSIAEGVVTQNRDLALSMRYNMSSEDMVRMQTGILSKLGRNVAIDRGMRQNENGEIIYNEDSEFENLIAASKVFGEDFVGDIASAFDKVGKSMGSAAKATGKLFQEAGEYGINLTQYSKNFVDNIGMAQMYNFRNGINGLKEMARKATEIRQNMKDVASFADKVGSVTGAVETAANLQVLGGSFTALANPLAMLNESLTNMEGLQDRFTKMTEGAAHYNSVTKQIEMDPVTRMRMKRAAEAMGVDASSMIDQAYAQARRGEITSQMEGYGGFSAEMQKLLPNVGEIDEYGRAGATIDGQFRTLGEIAANEELQKQLVEETRSESDDIKEIAHSVLGIEDMLSGRIEQTKNAAAYRVTQFKNAGGKSTYDNILETIENVFSPALIEGVSRLDTSLQYFADPLIIAGFRAIGSIGKVFSSNSPEEARKRGSDVVYDTINSFTSKDSREIGWAKPIANAAGGASEFGQKVTTFLGDISSQITGGEYDSAKFARGNNNVSIDTFPSPWYNPSNETPITPSVTQNQPFNWGWNNGTMPTAPVSKPESTRIQQESSRTLTKAIRDGGEYNIKLNGTLTMNVNGDKGNIGVEDIMDLINKNDSFRRELARIIGSAIVEMDKSGQTYNK